MALAPPRPCTVSTCPKLNCREHQVEAWRTRARPTVTRIRGRALQRMRAQLFTRHPWCARCLLKGLKTIATIRDHIIPIAEGGRDDATNEQALCLACSDAKTRVESARGARRSSRFDR
jgi:5-methylcytosine-specific restriction enzyme A